MEDTIHPGGRGGDFLRVAVGRDGDSFDADKSGGEEHDHRQQYT